MSKWSQVAAATVFIPVCHISSPCFTVISASRTLLLQAHTCSLGVCLGWMSHLSGGLQKWGLMWFAHMCGSEHCMENGSVTWHHVTVAPVNAQRSREDARSLSQSDPRIHQPCRDCAGEYVKSWLYSLHCTLVLIWVEEEVFYLIKLEWWGVSGSSQTCCWDCFSHGDWKWDHLGGLCAQWPLWCFFCCGWSFRREAVWWTGTLKVYTATRNRWSEWMFVSQSYSNLLSDWPVRVCSSARRSNI